MKVTFRTVEGLRQVSLEAENGEDYNALFALSGCNVKGALMPFEHRMHNTTKKWTHVISWSFTNEADLEPGAPR